MPTDSKTAGHTATPDPAMEAAIAIQREFVHAVASADAQEAKDCEARWRVRIAATIRMAYMPLDASNLRKVEALRDALRAAKLLLGRYVESLERGNSSPQISYDDAKMVLFAAERALALAEEQANETAG